MYLATRQHRATVAEVANFFEISNAHVAKVVNQLARLVFVRSIREIGGGIELARTPDRTSIGEVLSAFEGNMYLFDCVGVEGFCVIESFCKLKKGLAEAERMQLEYLNSITLADVLPTKRQITRVSDGTGSQ